MHGKQPLQQEVLMTIQATPNEIIALNHVLNSFLRFHHGQQQGKEKDVTVALIERFYHRIGGSMMEQNKEGYANEI